MFGFKPPKWIDAPTLLILGLAVGGAYVTHTRGGWAAVLHILHEDTQLLLSIFLKVLAGCIIGALLRLLIPRETIAHYVGNDSGIKGLILATLMGAIFPSGPFTIFPLAMSFLGSGAGVAPIIAFIASWAILSINRALVWEVPFFGGEQVLIRHILSFPLPILAGLLARPLEGFFFKEKP